MHDPVQLTRHLVRFKTINPPGDEQPCAEFLGSLLEDAGFHVAYHRMGENRANLVARIGGSAGKKPLCLSGHIDVVPLGAKPWSVDPFGAEVSAGRIYGRGSSDMKAGVAAIVTAAIELAPKLAHTPGLILVITAGEECGCDGARLMASIPGALGHAGALIVAEPTANQPLVGHKGCMWVEGACKGVTAHGSQPENGDNAVYKAARVVSKLAAFEFPPVTGNAMATPTLNVGWLRGGMNVNSVPDEAKFGLDIRTVAGLDEQEVLHALRATAQGEASFSLLGSYPPVWSDPHNAWVQSVFAVMERLSGQRIEPAIASYFTDASPLGEAYGNPPTLILGPGEPDQAHQTDEWCAIERIETAKAAFTEITRAWCGV